MYLEKIKFSYEHPAGAYAHNDVCYGLEGILKNYKMDSDVRHKLLTFYKTIEKLSFYNHYQRKIDDYDNFYEFNRQLYQLNEYLEDLIFPDIF